MPAARRSPRISRAIWAETRADGAGRWFPSDFSDRCTGSARECGVFQNINSPQRGTSPGSSSWSLILALIGFIGLCLLVAAVDGAMASRSLRTWYLTLAQPPGTPPAPVLGPVWTVLYVMIGIAGWLVWRRVGAASPVRLWGWQLLVNALWAPAFFGIGSTLGGLLVSIGMLVLVWLTLVKFLAVRPLAAALMVPYALWILYASYLAGGFWWLNPGLGAAS